jgi:hypothetical protein
MQPNKLFQAFTLMTLLGCSDAVKPGDLAVSVLPSRSALRAGDTITVAVTVFNVSDRDQTVSTKSCPSVFDVINQDGVDVGPKCDVFTLDIRNAVITPGGSYTYPGIWTGEQIDYQDGNYVRTPLVPGSYLLRAHVAASGVMLTGGVAEVQIIPK